MDKTRLSQDERIQKLNELNKDITVEKNSSRMSRRTTLHFQFL